MSILATTIGGAKASEDSVSVGAETLPGAVPVLEEQVVLNKDVVTTGRVRVTTQTKLADEVATATLDGHEVDVTRVKIGKPITGDLPQIRTEDVGGGALHPACRAPCLLNSPSSGQLAIAERAWASFYRDEIYSPLGHEGP